MDLKEKIIAYCNSLGLDLVGFTECRTFEELREFYQERKSQGLENEFEEQDIEKRINPRHYMSKGKTIISIAFPYLHEMDYCENGFSIYTRGLDYHKVVKNYLKVICEFIYSLGGEAMAFVDSNTLPERYIAYLSGIGFIGKNNLLITEKYGSYVFLGEIITDLEIISQSERTFEKIKEFKECGSCNKCYDVCPTKSINSVRKNSNICMSYITQKKEIEDKFIKLMDGRIFGCDTCQLICPKNQEIEISPIKEFKPLNFMNEDLTNKIVNINNGDFKNTFKITSCGWRGKNILVRNALIRKSIYYKEDICQEKFTSDYLKEYKNRLKKLQNKLK